MNHSYCNEMCHQNRVDEEAKIRYGFFFIISSGKKWSQ